VLARRRGCAPPGRTDRPWRAAVERPRGGLPHRGARPREGPDRQERRDRAGGRQGRVRGEAPPARPAELRERGRPSATGVHPALLDVTDDIVDGEIRRATRPTWCATTATTRTSWSRPTRARPRSATSPTRSPPSTASGSATRSRRAGAPATTTRRWASRPGAPGRASGATSVLGKNADTDVLTVVGIGDMSGDVFGNGMLRSDHLQARGRVRPPSHLPRPRSRSGRVVRRARVACSSSRARAGPTTTGRSSRPAAACSRDR
jgi:hypothetical protein